jgi:transcriptional regulator with XRE-family HTH domain
MNFFNKKIFQFAKISFIIAPMQLKIKKMKGKFMQTKLLNEITRRKEKIAQNYLKGVGQILKKKRIELKMTQEAVAIGICSNTYLSKIENNQIDVNQEHLYLLMERMHIPTDKISFPNEMLEHLETAVDLFFYRDIEGYEQLFNEIKPYDFAILLQIVKLGYYLLIDDLQKATLVHNEIFRYISILEDYGFSVFLVFSSYYNLAVKDFKNSRFILDNVANNLYSIDKLYALFNYAKFLTYGNLHLNTIAMESGFTAQQIFNRYSNISRINEFFIWKDIFTVYEGNYDLGVLIPNKIINLNPDLKNYYLVIMASRSKNPKVFLDHLESEADHYLLGLFIKGRYFLRNSKIDQLEEVLDKLQKLHYLKQSKIDFARLLKALKDNNELLIKELLINYCLDFAFDNQNLFFVEIITESISKLLSKKNRYKDALIYKNKFFEFKQSLQLVQQITVK